MATTEDAYERRTPRLAAPAERVEEEDAWLAEQVARLEIDDATTPPDPYAYHPQLMDALAMQSLRRELRTSEARVQRDGHMREFVPRRPASRSVRPRTTHQQQRSTRLSSPGWPTGNLQNPHEDAAMDPFVMQDTLKREYSEALREEVEQFNNLFEQYDDTKRVLLDHLDMVCSSKPTERTTSHEVYERLDELLVFAAKCVMGTSSGEKDK